MHRSVVHCLFLVTLIQSMSCHPYHHILSNQERYIIEKNLLTNICLISMLRIKVDLTWFDLIFQSFHLFLFIRLFIYLFTCWFILIDDFFFFFLEDKLHRSKWPFVLVYSDGLPKNAANKILRIRYAERYVRFMRTYSKSFFILFFVSILVLHCMYGSMCA